MKTPARTLLASSSLLLLSASVDGFAFVGKQQQQQQQSRPTSSATAASSSSSSSALHMGLFDGVKDAFSAPALERSTVASERETPIDRWMGWSVASDSSGNTEGAAAASAAAGVDFVDSMDEAQYVTVELGKPMGIVFEENDADFGGIFVQSLKEGGIAAEDETVQVGDQLVAVAGEKVSGLPFDDALGKIIDAEGDKVKLVFFRGTAEQLYGPTGASQAWLDEFIGGGSAAA